jgi:hypothetical protein
VWLTQAESPVMWSYLVTVMTMHNNFPCDCGHKVHIDRTPEVLQLQQTGHFKDCHCFSGIVCLIYRILPETVLQYLCVYVFWWWDMTAFGQLERNFSMIVYRPKVADWGTVSHGNKDVHTCSVTLQHSVYFLQLRDCSGLNLFQTLYLESSTSIELPISVFGSELRR